MPSRMTGFVCLSVVMVTTACWGGMEHTLIRMFCAIFTSYISWTPNNLCFRVFITFAHSILLLTRYFLASKITRYIHALIALTCASRKHQFNITLIYDKTSSVSLHTVQWEWHVYSMKKQKLLIPSRDQTVYNNKGTNTPHLPTRYDNMIV